MTHEGAATSVGSLETGRGPLQRRIDRRAVGGVHSEAVGQRQGADLRFGLAVETGQLGLEIEVQPAPCLLERLAILRNQRRQLIHRKVVAERSQQRRALGGHVLTA